MEPTPPRVLPLIFESAVADRPGAVALECAGESVTYAGLNARANRLARFLTARGLGPGSLVAVAVRPSVAAVTCVLAIAKAGAGYVPVDPGYPAPRVRFMLEDCASDLVLTDAGGTLDVPGSLAVPEVEAAAVAYPEHDLTDDDRPAPLTSADTAYVIYTSGSTGTPKGVVVTHTGLAPLAGSRIERFAVTSASRVLQFASLSFDASVSELCMAFGAGATLVMCTGDSRLPHALPEFVRTHRVTHATLPPSVLAALPDDATFPSLETLVVAGEACSAELVARWAPGRRMVNAYGPTEVTVCATMSRPLSDATASPIGRPIDGARVYVLDARLEPVPVGVAGEVYVAGAGLARGYLGRPALTEPDPVGPGRRPPTARTVRGADTGPPPRAAGRPHRRRDPERPAAGRRPPPARTRLPGAAVLRAPRLRTELVLHRPAEHPRPRRPALRDTGARPGG